MHLDGMSSVGNKQVYRGSSLRNCTKRLRAISFGGYLKLPEPILTWQKCLAEDPDASSRAKKAEEATHHFRARFLCSRISVHGAILLALEKLKRLPEQNCAPQVNAAETRFSADSARNKSTEKPFRTNLRAAENLFDSPTSGL